MTVRSVLRLTLALLLAFGAFLSVPALAQTKVIVVGFAAGGTVDALARALAVEPALQAAWGPQIVIDNRPGNRGLGAAQFMATQPGDGSRLLLMMIEKNGPNAELSQQVATAARNFVPIAYLGDAINSNGIEAWYALLGPPGMPSGTARALEQAVQAAVRTSTFSERSTLVKLSQVRGTGAAIVAQQLGAGSSQIATAVASAIAQARVPPTASPSAQIPQRMEPPPREVASTRSISGMPPLYESRPDPDRTGRHLAFAANGCALSFAQPAVRGLRWSGGCLDFRMHGAGTVLGVDHEKQPIFFFEGQIERGLRTQGVIYEFERRNGQFVGSRMPVVNGQLQQPIDMPFLDLPRPFLLALDDWQRQINGENFLASLGANWAPTVNPLREVGLLICEAVEVPSVFLFVRRSDDEPTCTAGDKVRCTFSPGNVYLQWGSAKELDVGTYRVNIKLATLTANIHKVSRKEKFNERTYKTSSYVGADETNTKCKITNDKVPDDLKR